MISRGEEVPDTPCQGVAMVTTEYSTQTWCFLCFGCCHLHLLRYMGVEVGMGSHSSLMVVSYKKSEKTQKKQQILIFMNKTNIR